MFYLFLYTMKNFIAGLLMTIIVAAPVATASAQAVTDQTFNDLMASILAIGQAITGSTQLTDAESLSLMTQLVTLSQTIMAVKAEYKRKGLIDALPVSEDGKVTAAEAKLERIILAYDAKTEAVTVSIKFSTTTRESSFTFVPNSPTEEYGSKLGRLITDQENQLSNSLGVLRKDIEKVMYVTSRNPVRDTTPIAHNSTLAYNLAENFARYSIVNRVEVRPGDGQGQIEFYTDQNESLRLSLKRNVDEFGTFQGTYTYTIQFFFPSLLTQVMSGSGSIDTMPVEIAQYEQIDDEVAQEDVLEFVIGLFTDAPFATAISNFDTRLMRFLTQNTTYYSDSVADATTALKHDCYRASDKKAVTEFVLFLTEGIEYQHEDLADIIEYVSPIKAEEYGALGACSSAPRFF